MKILVRTTVTKNANLAWTCEIDLLFLWIIQPTPHSHQEGKQFELRKWFWMMFVSTCGPDWNLGNPTMGLGWYATSGDSGPLYRQPQCVYVQVCWPEHVQYAISSISAVWQESVVPWKITDVSLNFTWTVAQLHVSQLGKPGSSLESPKEGAGLSISECTLKIRTETPTSV